MLGFATQELEKLKNQGLLRELKAISKISGNKIIVDGKEYINFCSNNYLGLIGHPQVKEKAKKAIDEFGFGAGASRLISGTTILHQRLEEKLAKLKGTEAALVFTSGYQANLGIIPALLTEKDTVIIDRLNHASIIDACKSSKAKLQVYPHKDLGALEKILKKSSRPEKRLIITDLIFSMDGDIAPITGIVELGKRYKALVMTDEAHATGIIDKKHNADIIMGTLSKALGSLGGFVCAGQNLIDCFINKSRSFIYTTALPPTACAVALASLKIIETEPEILKKLWDNIAFMKEKIQNLGFNTMGTETPIIPILIGDADKTMRASKILLENGVFVSGIRPPTVPKGQARLRITVTASHTKEEMEQLTHGLKKI